VQELYDQRVLHSIVGVEPLPTVVKHVESEPRQSPSSKRQAVEDAWDEKRRNREHAYDESSSSRQHHRVANDGEEGGGRYDIGRHRPKKRRKTGRAMDNHPVIFVDDEEERHRYHDDDDYYSEDHEYDHRRESDFENYKSYPENPRNDRRRSYWLSKGIGPGNVDDESY
jgi:non-canonical poly(A) RNA polymerase PAPD5/7